MRLILIVLSLFFSSCATVPIFCPVEKAHEMGAALVNEGKKLDLENIIKDKCTDEKQQALFKTNLEAGYAEAKITYCDPEPLFKLGKAEGARGKREYFDYPKYRICENFHEMRLALDHGVTLGLSHFCREETADSRGQKMGEEGLERDLSESMYGVCGVKPFPQLKRAFGRGYEKGLISFCDAGKAKASALDEGRRGASPDNLDVRFRACAPADQATLSSLFSSEYEVGLQQYCAPEKIKEEAQR